MLNQPIEFRDHVRRGGLGKTAKMWIAVPGLCMDAPQIPKRKERSITSSPIWHHWKTCPPLFFTYDHPNYSHDTVVYIFTMPNLDKTHPGAEKLLKGSGISVNRSSIPSSRNAVDITVEQTINKHDLMGKKCNHIQSDPSHPLSSNFEELPSGE